MSELTPLREAIDTLASRATQPDLSELKRRADHRGRRRIALGAAATALVVAAAVLVVTGQDDDRRVAPIKPPAPIPTAEQIIGGGHLYDFGVTASGDVLTVWTTCHEWRDTHCGHAWRLGTGRRPLATGIVAVNTPDTSVDVIAGDDMFLLEGIVLSLQVSADGSVNNLTDAACRVAYPPLKPGRLAWDGGKAYDLAGVYCPSSLGSGDRPDPILDGSSLTGPGAFTADGRLWALVDNWGHSAPQRETIATFDGTRWRYHDLAARGDASESMIAAVGSTVVVLSRSGISVTTDGGGTWHEVTDPDVLAQRLPTLTYDASNGCCTRPSMAFAGPSTLYVTDSHGGLWRSTDLTTFRRVETPSRVLDLKPAGDEAFARVSSPDALLRLTADGRVQTLVVR